MCTNIRAFLKIHKKKSQLKVLAFKSTYIHIHYVVPLGRPSCCNSLSNDEPSTECLAALDNMNDRAATMALTSDSSTRQIEQVINDIALCVTYGCIRVCVLLCKVFVLTITVGCFELFLTYQGSLPIFLLAGTTKIENNK